jgi:hypothetical protein
MEFLSKDQILSTQDLKTEIIEIPEWNCKLRISEMTGFARDRYEESCLGKKGGVNLVNIRARLAAATVVDENGDLMFTEKDIIKLGNKSGAALNRIYEAAQRINKINDNDVEELAKN